MGLSLDLIEWLQHNGAVKEAQKRSPSLSLCRGDKTMKTLCRELGIQPGGMHAFRHGRVSQLQAIGAPADFPKSQVGRRSLRATSAYTHFTDAFKREIVERLAPKLMFCTQPA